MRGEQSMDINEKFTRALELQEQGTDRREIYKLLEYQSIDALTKMMRKFGYKYDKFSEKYIKAECNTDCNTDSHTKSNTGSNTKRNTAVKVIEKQELKTTAEQIAVLQFMEQEQETLIQMLEWYKRMSNTDSNTDSNTFIRVELPQSENVMISARSNKVVWEEFKEFTKKHSVNFKMGDLLAQALKEYMEKYKQM